MRFFIDRPNTYVSVNNKGKEFNEWIYSFKHVLIANELSRDAFIEGIRQKASMLDAKYPRTRKLYVSVTEHHGDDCIFISVYPEHQPEKQVFILNIYHVRGDFQFSEHITPALESKAIPGICKVCGCTDDDPCWNPVNGTCWWADEEQTLCSHCADLTIKNHPDTVHCINSLQAKKGGRS